MTDDELSPTGGLGAMIHASERFYLAFNDILCRNMAGDLLEGHPPAVDEPVALSDDAIATGTDPVIPAAEAWLARISAF
jgi:hypothetical protein